MQLELGKIPFSAYGSYFAITEGQEDGMLYLRDLHGGDEAPSALYQLKVRDTEEANRSVDCQETQLIIKNNANPEQKVCIVYGERDTVHIRTYKMALVLEAVGGKYDTLVPLSESQIEHHLYQKQLKIMFTKVSGRIRQEQEWAVIGSKNAQIIIEEDSYVVIESYKATWKRKKYPSWEAVKERTKVSFEQWEKSFPNPSGLFEESRKLAAYITWANFVHQEGCLSADAMYMSKNWMYNIWSWDNCFAGIALSKFHPDLAYGQLQIFMEQQDKSGCYPDYVNDLFSSYNCVKPPIHGWAYEKMAGINQQMKTPKRRKEVYESLGKVTKYWMHHRKIEGSVFPVYYHGNDSGWDNASTFHRGFPVESPDLAAFLIYQMDCLVVLAGELGEIEEQVQWQSYADDYYHRLMERFYIQGQFHAIYIPTGEAILEGDSLLMYLPILIGYRLERTILEKMVTELEERFETTYGLATEAPKSDYYKEGGYWLGPIWAPTTYLFIDALRANGYEIMAKRLALKFCKLTVTGLMSENYDPFTGEGYDDPAFSWPSCVLLQLLAEYENMGEEM